MLKITFLQKIFEKSNILGLNKENLTLFLTVKKTNVYSNIERRMSQWEIILDI